MTFSRYNKFDKRCASNIHEIRREIYNRSNFSSFFTTHDMW